MTDAREALVALLWEKFGAGPNGPLAAWLTEADCARFADAILAEFDVTPRGEGQWWESLVEAPCDKGHRVFIDDGDGGVYACPACALLPTVKPSLEQVVDALAAQRPGSAEWTSSRIMQTARAVLALSAGRTEAEVKAEALREAAETLRAEDKGHDRWYADWLEQYAARIARGEGS